MMDLLTNVNDFCLKNPECDCRLPRPILNSILD